LNAIGKEAGGTPPPTPPTPPPHHRPGRGGRGAGGRDCLIVFEDPFKPVVSRRATSPTSGRTTWGHVLLGAHVTIDWYSASFNQSEIRCVVLSLFGKPSQTPPSVGGRVIRKMRLHCQPAKAEKGHDSPEGAANLEMHKAVLRAPNYHARRARKCVFGGKMQRWNDATTAGLVITVRPRKLLQQYPGQLGMDEMQWRWVYKTSTYLLACSSY